MKIDQSIRWFDILSLFQKHVSSFSKSWRNARAVSCVLNIYSKVGASIFRFSVKDKNGFASSSRCIF